MAPSGELHEGEGAGHGVRRYTEFRVDLTDIGDGAVAVRASSRLGETPTSRSAATGAVAVEKDLNPQELLDVGAQLGRLLMPAPVLKLFNATLAALSDDEGVRIRIVADPSLSVLPWEYAHVNHDVADTSLSPPLVLDPRVSLIRHEAQPSPPPLLSSRSGGEFRLLVVSAPRVRGFDELERSDAAVVQRALQSALVPGTRVVVECVTDPRSRADVQRALEGGVDAFHFSGHAVIGDDGAARLVLGAPDGEADLVDPEDLAQVLEAAGVRLAVLNACDTGSRRGEGVDSLATDLVSRGIAAVVAMQHEIENSHAILFANGFYVGIAGGLILDEAAFLGRKRVAEIGILPEWGVPVVYTRSDGVLFPERAVGALALEREVRNRPLDLSAGLREERDGDWAAATDFYGTLLNSTDAPSERALLFFRMGSCRWRDGEPDEGEEFLERAAALADDVGNPVLVGQIHLERGRLAEEQGDLPEASRLYAEAAELLSTDPDARVDVELRLCSVRRRLGDTANAIERLKAIDPSGLPPARRAEYLDELGATCIALGHYGTAIEVLEDALQLDLVINTPFLAGQSRLLLAEANLGAGSRREALRLVDQAIEAYEVAHDERGLSEAYALRGRILEESSQFAEALKSYRQGWGFDVAGQDRLGEARIHRLLGRTARKSGDFIRAEEYFARAHDLLGATEDDIERGQLLSEEAFLDLDEGDFDKATIKLNKALEIAEEDGDPRAIALAQRNLARALRERGDVLDAEKLLREAMPVLEAREDWRELEELLDDLGELLLEQGKFDDAIEYLLASQRLDDRLQSPRGRARTLLLLGRAYLFIGKRRTAESHLRDALNAFAEFEDEVGESDALHQLACWLVEEGRSKDALDHLRRALKIDRHQEDRLGVVRNLRVLAQLYRRRGDLIRAEEHLDDARSEIGGIPDRLERALLDVEEASLGLARGEVDDAARLVSQARREFEHLHSTVNAATAMRLEGVIRAAQGELTRALALLTQARDTFASHGALAEVDTTLDEIGAVLLALGRVDEARDAVKESLRIGQINGWKTGNGRSQIILGRIEARALRPELARRHFEDALAEYLDVGDTAGAAEAHYELGAWALDNAHQDARHLDEAIRELKLARRLYQEHRDLFGTGRSFRKLGQVYARIAEYHRAQEALEEADEYLRTASVADRAPLERDLGELLAARGQHERAIRHYENAVDLYRELDRDDKVNDLLRRLAASHQSIGDLDRALEYVKQIGVDQLRLWHTLIDSLPGVDATSAVAYFHAEQYEAVVRDVAVSLCQCERRGRDEKCVGHVLLDRLAQGWQVTALEAVAAVCAAFLVRPPVAVPTAD